MYNRCKYDRVSKLLARGVFHRVMNELPGLVTPAYTLQNWNFDVGHKAKKLKLLEIGARYHWDDTVSLAGHVRSMHEYLHRFAPSVNNYCNFHPSHTDIIFIAIAVKIDLVFFSKYD